MVGIKLNFYLRRVYFLKICASVLLATCVTHNLCSQADSEIVLGSIESELQKKQIPIDLGDTPKTMAAVVGKAISIHGGLRLSSPQKVVSQLHFPPKVRMWYKFLSHQESPKEMS